MVTMTTMENNGEGAPTCARARYKNFSKNGRQRTRARALVVRRSSAARGLLQHGYARAYERDDDKTLHVLLWNLHGDVLRDKV